MSIKPLIKKNISLIKLQTMKILLIWSCSRKFLIVQPKNIIQYICLAGKHEPGKHYFIINLSIGIDSFCLSFVECTKSRIPSITNEWSGEGFIGMKNLLCHLCRMSRLSWQAIAQCFSCKLGFTFWTSSTLSLLTILLLLLLHLICFHSVLCPPRTWHFYG